MATHIEPIELPILFVPFGEVKMHELGLGCGSEPRPMLFFNINGITPYIDPEGNLYTSILCNGGQYVCPLPYKEVVRRLRGN